MRIVVWLPAIFSLLALLPLPATAADGMIAVSAPCGQDHACIFVMDERGMHKRPVYRTGLSGSTTLIPSWSPDRTSIALTDRGELYRIAAGRLTVRPDGMLIAPREGELWSGGGPAAYNGLRHPAWAPAGGLIAVKSVEPQAVCIIDEWGAGWLEAVYLPPEGARLHGGRLAWNSDGTRLAFFLAVAPGEHDLVIVDLVDGAVERIAPEDVGAPHGWSQPAWANLGDPRIVFCGDDWIHSFDTRTGEMVARLTEGCWPAWSPDNSRIALRRQVGKVYSLDLETRELRRLGDGSFPSWAGAPRERECAGDLDCGRGLCCEGICVSPCERDRDCDDADVTSGDYCLYAGSCKAYCYHIW